MAALVQKVWGWWGGGGGGGGGGHLQSASEGNFQSICAPLECIVVILGVRGSIFCFAAMQI
jgi:hypothetical protein